MDPCALFLLSLAVVQLALATANSLFEYCCLRLLRIAHAILVNHPEIRNSPLARTFSPAGTFAVIIKNLDKSCPECL